MPKSKKDLNVERFPKLADALAKDKEFCLVPSELAEYFLAEETFVLVVSWSCRNFALVAHK
jgi:hypothetical protein